MEKFTRRQLLGSIGVATVVSTAGCSALNGNDDDNNSSSTPTTEPSDSGSFDYPEGFTEKEIAVETAFGQNSPMLSVSSLQVEFNQALTRDGTTQSNREVGQFDSESQTALVSSEQSSGQQSATQEFYVEDGSIFIRQETPNAEEPQYQRDDYEWNPQQLYRLSLLQQYLTGVEMEVDRVTEQNGTAVAVYTADSVEDFTSESIFGSGESGLGELNEGSVSLGVDENGWVHFADFAFAFGAEGGTEVSVELDYSNHNDATVSKPSWVDNNEFTDLSVEASATVNFDETEGESVDVIVESMESADRVDVVVGQQLAGNVQEPGTITVEASSYTVDGQAAQIQVFARREGQQPTQVATYQPTAPASGDTNTTTTNETDTSGSIVAPALQTFSGQL